MSAGRTLLISDVHTNYAVINAQVDHAEQVLGLPVAQVIVLGDFGFFGDDLHRHFRRQGQRFRRPVAAIEGNHEDHAALPALALRFADVVTHLPRGTLCRVGAWRGLCLGGARYMDAASTPRGCEITERDIARCLAHPAGQVDVVLSHDCPAGLGVPGQPGLEHYGAPGMLQLGAVAAHHRPRWWVFGHHHQWFELEREGTTYLGLPESWQGYALLDDVGELATVPHEVPRVRRAWWQRLAGLD